MIFSSDKLHEECGVFAIYGHPEAANMAYLGLYQLQHRGQESAGIATSDGRDIHCYKSMGHVADIFTPAVINGLPGEVSEVRDGEVLEYSVDEAVVRTECG